VRQRRRASSVDCGGADGYIADQREPLAPVGSIEAIHIAASAGTPVRPVDEIRAVAGVGLEGDRYADGGGHYQDGRVSRDLTLIEAEAVEALVRAHGIALAPGETRRNLTTRGVGQRTGRPTLLGRRGLLRGHAPL
jgi:hypothetical protein